MSDDKLQLTECDYSAEPADEYAAGDAGTPSYEAVCIELPATSSSSSGRPPLSDGTCFDPPATSDTARPVRYPCQPYDDRRQLGPVTELPAGHDQHHQRAQPRHPRRRLAIRRRSQSTSTDDDTPRRMSCTPRQWAAVGVCIVIKIIVICFIIWVRRHYYN